MATAMPPPMLPGFSLRVQLYSPNAYSSGDKPIRCFRVVTNPNVTIREFCQEASRIHEINYGLPLAIKKCQDDQEFDVTQSEIIGNLFVSTATIRVIQASAHPSIRDSIPPTSALRFDPVSVIGQKRDRETSSRSNGASPSSSYKPNKRQRASDMDPDHPIPSRESQDEAERLNGCIQDSIPNSQESMILGVGNERFSTSRHVRPFLPRIPETPSVSPPPSVLRNGYEMNADLYRQKLADNRSSKLPELRESSLTREPAGRAQSQQRAKSASYHIHRPTESGTSVSTTATSPLSVDQQHPMANGVTSTWLKASDPDSNSRKSSGNKDRSENEDSIYDNFESDDEGSAILRAKKAALKARNSPNSRLQGPTKFNTLPNGRRRSREQANIPGELSLTQTSKEREEKQKQKQQADDARKARIAAAEAAEQRKREADEARHAEKARRAEVERAEREEQERIEVEEFKRNEAERIARLKREREEKEQWDAEEKRVAQEKEEAEHLARDKAQTEETKRMREAQQRQVEQAKADRLEAERVKKAEAPARLASSPPEVLRQAKSSSPVLPRTNPFTRAQSSTSFFPPGRKSALKSSQAVRSSSPAAAKPSSSNGVGIEAQMPLPRSNSRRVSFENAPENIPMKHSPRIPPPTKSITPPSATPKAITSTASNTSASKPVSKTPILPPKPAYRRIVPSPSAIKRNSAESITPQVQKKVALTQSAKEQSLTKKMSPPSTFSARRSHTPVVPLVYKAKSKSISPELSSKKPEKEELSSEDSSSEVAEDDEDSEDETATKPSPKNVTDDSDEDAESEDDSEEDVPSRISPAKSALGTQILANTNAPEESSDDSEEDIPARINPAKSAPCSPAKAAEESEDEADVETASHHTSSRDSRSPVIYSQHEQAQQTIKPRRSASPESDHTSNKDEVDESSTSEDSTAKHKKDEDGEKSSESENDAEDTTIQVPKSSPVLPKITPASTARTLKDTISKSKSSTLKNTSKAQSPLGSDPSTQEELDYQLTSSMIEAHRPSTSSPAPSSSISSALHVPRFGTSLTGLMEKKQTFSSSAPMNEGRGKHQLKLQEDDEESQEESDDDSESASGSESEHNASTKLVVTPQTKKGSDVDEDSDSEGESESSEDSKSEEDEAVKIRNELARSIQNMHCQTLQDGIPSQKAYRSGAQERGKRKGVV